jgi:hypothetical protein
MRYVFCEEVADCHQGRSISVPTPPPPPTPVSVYGFGYFVSFHTPDDEIAFPGASFTWAKALVSVWFTALAPETSWI